MHKAQGKMDSVISPINPLANKFGRLSSLLDELFETATPDSRPQIEHLIARKVLWALDIRGSSLILPKETASQVLEALHDAQPESTLVKSIDTNLTEIISILTALPLDGGSISEDQRPYDSESRSVEQIHARAGGCNSHVYCHLDFKHVWSGFTASVIPCQKFEAPIWRQRNVKHRWAVLYSVLVCFLYLIVSVSADQDRTQTAAGYVATQVF